MPDYSDRIAVSLPEAARLLGISKPTIYKYAGRSDFPAFRLGGRVLVSVEGLHEWVRKQTEVTESA